MKKTIKSVLFWIAIPLFSAGFTIAFRSSPAQWFGYVPILECPQTVDLGEWNIGEAAFGSFKIKNAGKRTLVVKEFTTSCSCMGVEREIDGHFSRVQTIEISSGDEVELTVRFGISAQPGESQSVSVFFTTNDPLRPMWQIDVLIPRVGGGYFAQPSAALFGILSVGDKSSRTIDLFNNRVESRRVESVRSTHPDRFSVRLLSFSEEDKQRRHQTAGHLLARIEVTPLSEYSGPIDGEVIVSLAKETHRTPPIPVLGEVIRPVACRPAMLVLPRRVGNQSLRNGDVLIFHRSEKPIDVVLDSVPPHFKAEIQAVSDHPDQRLLHIEWRPATTSNEQSITETRLHLRVHSDGEETKLELPIFAENRP